LRLARELGQRAMEGQARPQAEARLAKHGHSPANDGAAPIISASLPVKSSPNLRKCFPSLWECFQSLPEARSKSGIFREMGSFCQNESQLIHSFYASMNLE
jgi:hypothetical protein